MPILTEATTITEAVATTTIIIIITVIGKHSIAVRKIVIIIESAPCTSYTCNQRNNLWHKLTPRYAGRLKDGGCKHFIVFVF